jgi:hypothetical protein
VGATLTLSVDDVTKRISDYLSADPLSMSKEATALRAVGLRLRAAQAKVTSIKATVATEQKKVREYAEAALKLLTAEAALKRTPGTPGK